MALSADHLQSRERMLSAIARGSAVALALALLLLIPSHLATPASFVVFGGGAALSFLAASVERLGYRTRALLSMAAVSAVCFYACARLGYAPNAMVALASVSVTATLLLGRPWGIAAILVSAAGVVGLSIAQRTGILVRDVQWSAAFDSTNAVTTIRITFTFVMASAISVLGVSYLVTRAERLALERAESLARLASEQEEKERIRGDLVRTEAAYRKAAELEILGRLSGAVAHDFNNALLVISTAIDELSESSALSAEQREAVAVIRAAADQATATSRDLRAFMPQAPSKATAPLSLSHAVRHMGALLKRVLPKSIEVLLDVADDVVLSADDAQIQRMVTNLALNARDAMRDGGTLTLRVRVASGRAVLEVVDTGSGMDEAVRERLFEPFFTTKGGAGTGLGLASVRELVEQQGGTVDVASSVGQGTTFTLSWPLLDASSPHPPAVTDRVLSATETRVLLVDDDAAVRKIIARGLRARGYEVVEATDAETGLSVARRHREPIHVLVSDCVMPGMPVRVLVDGFRSAHPGGRVIMCSGYAPDDIGLPLHSADAFLTKPFTGDTLAREIQRLSPERETGPAG